MSRLRRRIVEGTAERILDLLRRQPMTVDELAATLGVTATAVRGQLATLQRDELVEHHGSRRGASKPARIYGATTHAQLLLSRAYAPILTHLLRVLARRLGPAELEAVMREAGRSASSDQPVPRGPLRDRVARASSLLNDLGGLTEVEEEGGRYLIRGHGCLLAAVTVEHREVCSAMEVLLTEFVGLPVSSCCDRNGHARCCFRIAPSVGETMEAGP